MTNFNFKLLWFTLPLATMYPLFWIGYTVLTPGGPDNWWEIPVFLSLIAIWGYSCAIAINKFHD